MGFLNFRRTEASGPDKAQRPAHGAAAESIQELRTRARHRLIGAVILVAAAVIGFPLIFDTAPRPTAVDAPIVIVGSSNATGSVGKAAPHPAEPARTPDATPAASGADRQQAEADQPAAAESSAPRAPVAQPPVPAAPPQATSGSGAGAPQVATKVRVQPGVPEANGGAHAKPPVAAAHGDIDKSRDEVAARKREEARALAALEGRPPPAPAAAQRFVVQVGAFAQAEQVRSTREQIERLGIKVHTQEVQTPQGTRTRVRVGPYADRAEAEQVVQKLKKAGLTGSIVPL